MNCVAYFKSGIGNFIVATPALQLLAKYDDREQIDIVFDKFWHHDPRIEPLINIIENCFFVHELIKAPNENFDINKYNIPYLTVQSETSKLAKEIRKKMQAPIVWPNDFWNINRLHECDINIQNVLTILECKKIINRAELNNIEIPYLFCPKADAPIIEEKYPRPFIGVCNSYQKGTKIMEKKKWPHFGKLTELLKKKLSKCTIIGVGGNNELDECNLDLNYAGKLTMIESSKVIDQLDFIITTDTGNMHIADAHKIKGIALFGGTLISKNGPLNKTIEPIRSNISCSPCQGTNLFYTCEYNGCMEKLSPEMVMEKVEEWL